MPDGANVDDVRARFGATADKVAEHSEQQVEMVREQLRSFVTPRGTERAWRRSCGRWSASTSSRSCSSALELPLRRT